MSTSLAEGVSYLPTQDDFQPSVSIQDLKDRNIRYVRIQCLDLIHNIRVRVVSWAYFKKLIELSRPGISLSKVILGIAFLTLAEGFRYVFDTKPS